MDRLNKYETQISALKNLPVEVKSHHSLKTFVIDQINLNSNTKGSNDMVSASQTNLKFTALQREIENQNTEVERKLTEMRTETQKLNR